VNVAVRVPSPPRAEFRLPPELGRGGPYLRTYRIQARPLVRTRVVALLLIAASLLFARVWEITVANSLSMDRDRLAQEVRALENRIRISRDLREQAVLGQGLDLTSLGQLGFRNPDPAQVIDIDLSETASRGAMARRGLAARLGTVLRQILPSSFVDRGPEFPAASSRDGAGR